MKRTDIQVPNEQLSVQNNPSTTLFPKGARYNKRGSTVQYIYRPVMLIMMDSHLPLLPNANLGPLFTSLSSPVSMRVTLRSSAVCMYSTVTYSARNVCATPTNAIYANG